jgi:transketolase
MRDAFLGSLIELAEKDDRVALLTGDLGFGVVEKFETKFPGRFWNCGVAEQSMIGIAAGLAKSGMLPFVYSIANFPTFRCLEQIRNDICYHNLPVTIVSVGAGLGYGTLGYTHHGIEDIAAMRSLPNISIYSPSDPNDVNHALARISNNPSPTYLRLGKNGEPEIKQATGNSIPGSIRELISGVDLTILATGGITESCLQVAEQLRIQGFGIQVISVTQIEPLDVKFLLATISSSKILVVEEHVKRGGFAAALLEAFNERVYQVQLYRLFVDQGQIGEIGTQEYLRGLSGLDKLGIGNKCLEILQAENN